SSVRLQSGGLIMSEPPAMSYAYGREPACSDVMSEQTHNDCEWLALRRTAELRQTPVTRRVGAESTAQAFLVVLNGPLADEPTTQARAERRQTLAARFVPPPNS